MGVDQWIRSGAASDDPEAPIVQPPASAAPARVPVAPQAGGVPVPDQADRLPRRAAHSQALLWWLGTHGGAGESTLARIAAATAAAEHSWPVPAGAGTQSRVVLVARTNYAGLTAAQRAAREWASGALGEAIRLDGLVLVADQPGKLPKELRDLAHVVSGGVPRSWLLPWVAEWRVAPATPGEALPAAFTRMFSDLNLHPSQVRI